MPYAKFVTNARLENETVFLKNASKIVSGILGKPETYVMTSLEKAPMTFKGSDEPAMFVEIKSIGLPQAKTKEISKEICDFLEKETGVPKDRVYIEFADSSGGMWGWNGSTF